MSRETVLAYLASAPVATLAAALLDQNPWLCSQLDVHFSTWSDSLLVRLKRPRAALFLVGSAALGFSLHPEKAGRPFRMLRQSKAPSDLDLALVDLDLFDCAWREAKKTDRLGNSLGVRPVDRKNVYWGRMEPRILPKRTRPSVALLEIRDSIRRSAEFRGYPASIRLYRERSDLESYTAWSLTNLARGLANEPARH